MESTVTVFLVVMTTIISSALSQQCPGVCNCKGNKVECIISKATFPAGIPTTVTSLTIDSTSPKDHNNFGELVRDSFSTFKDLSEIVLSRCGITGIAIGTFMDLTKLTSLTLKSNKLDGLYPGSFMLGEAQTLQTLKLSSNGLKRLQDYTFRGLRVDVLDLSGNDIESIEAETFFEASVKSLNLSNNKLKTLGGATLRPLAESLTTLDMRRNGMKSFDEDLLSSLTKLVEINLSWNMIREVTPDMLNKLTNLKDLNLEHNAMTGLREEFLEIIDRVNAINVNTNSFNCNCDLKWLKTFAQPNETCQQKNKCFTAVRCTTPKDVLLKDFPEDEFKCSGVKILGTEVKLAEATCRAKGDPAPKIWWKAPSGTLVSASNVSYGVTHTNSTIRITLASEIGQYECIAGNSLGNVSAFAADVGTCRSRNVCYGPGDVAGAVLGTFCFCIILVALLWGFRDKICKRKDGRKKTVPRFRNNVYKDVTTPVSGKNGERERL
ncbi:leucine-rich repeat-containing protein 4C-like [Lineus longissimus]|uniref:leucine-rich repeat-containing protein 4C-like n=1 Tax=Lineus longissimus TaxID=88925 RepID=UPI00315D1EEA